MLRAFVGLLALVGCARDAHGTYVESFETLVSGPTGFSTVMTYWNNGDEAKWIAAVDASIRLVIPSLGADYTGTSEVWSFRTDALAGGVANSPFDWVEVYDTFSVATGGALLCSSKSFTRSNTKLLQLGEWAATFSSDDKINRLDLDALYDGSAVGAFSTMDDLGASQLVHGARGFGAFARFWESGAETSWLSTVDDAVRYEVPRRNVNVTGSAAVWAYRGGLEGAGDGTRRLAVVNTFDSFSLADGVLRAKMKSFNRTTGELVQLADVAARFTAAGRVRAVREDVAWAVFLPSPTAAPTDAPKPSAAPFPGPTAAPTGTQASKSPSLLPTPQPSPPPTASKAPTPQPSTVAYLERAKAAEATRPQAAVAALALLPGYAGPLAVKGTVVALDGAAGVDLFGTVAGLVEAGATFAVSERTWDGIAI